MIPGAGDNGRRLIFEPRRRIEYLLGREIARSYSVRIQGEKRQIQCVTAGAAWTSSDNLVTTTKYYTNGSNGGREWTVEHPDGTLEVRDYWIGLNRTNIVLIGAPNTNKTDVTNGTKTITVIGPVGQLLSRTVTDIPSSITLASEIYSDHDLRNRPTKVTYLDGTSNLVHYSSCCGVTTETNREGTITYHEKDALKRRTVTIRNSITNKTVLDAAGNMLQRLRIGSDGTQITQATNNYDTAGRRLSSKDALANVTTYSEMITNNQLIRTTTYPDGGTGTEEYYRDGQLAKITGTAVHPVRYEYGVEEDGTNNWRAYTKEIKLDGNGSDTSEWTKTYRDMVGHSYKTVYADGATNQSFYNTKGQLAKTVDPDGVTTLYEYNTRGELEYTVTDMNRDGTNDLAGTDRIRQTVRSVTTKGASNVVQTKTYVWATNNSGVSTLVSVNETKTDGRISWNASYGLTNQTAIGYTGSGNRYVTNTAPDGSYTVTHFQHGQLMSATRKDASGNQLSSISYTYDAHDRQKTVADARNGTTTYAYDNADRRSSVTTPLPGTGQNPQTTSYTYDFAGRITRTGLPDGGGITNVYSSRGELLTNYGTRTYPVAYAYDAQGRRTNMITWTNFAAKSGAATTVWKFEGQRGFMTNKVYADGNGPKYTYTPAGRLKTRTWARGTVTTYETNAAGDVVIMTYSDGTAAVTNLLDRLGRKTNVVDGAGSRFMTYSDSGLLLMETNVSGTLAGMSITNGYDSLLRRTTLTVRSNATTLLTHSYTYDSASRLTNASDGTYNATYSYLANSPLVSEIAFRSNSTTRMTTTKSYDNLNRLLSISSLPSAAGQSAISYAYAYNDANQRTRVTHADGSYWLYEYDNLGQLISGKHYWSDGTPVAGQQHEYAYDDIGNRNQAKVGGDSLGAGLRSASYTANNLNQYTSRDVPSAADIIGIAHANATVTVNGGSAYRKGEYYWKELSISNASAAVWQAVTNIASLSGTNQTNTGNLFLAKTAETFGYDPDGNTTNDGRFAYTWDAENRMTKAESQSTAPTGSKRKVVYEYDGQGRMVRRTEYDGSSGSYVVTNDLKFARDGWACLADLDAQNAAAPLHSYLWGMDVSGSMTGAGGVGGLLAVKSTGNGVHFCAMDGNGNMVATVKASDGTTSAVYEYDPFGKGLRATGTMAKENPFRFSTKRADDGLDLTVYEYRPYNPSSGRWLTRDPIQEHGGNNLYTFAFNAAVNHFDRLGKECPPLEARMRLVAPDPKKPNTFGETVLTSWVLSTVVERCHDAWPCREKVRIRACWATTDSWFTDNGAARDHEQEHVDIFASAWDSALASASGYVDQCVSRRKALCYQTVVSLFSQAYQNYGWANNWEIHCGDILYPEACGEEQTYRNRADDFHQRGITKSQECSTLE
jgi:RHS repeat-associated protein